MGLQMGMAKQGTPVQWFLGPELQAHVKKIMAGFAVTGFPQCWAVSQDPASNEKLVEDDPTHIQTHS